MSFLKFMRIFFFSVLFIYSANTYAEKSSDTRFFGGEWYISWGYNRDYWAPSDIHVSQSGLGNDFTVHQVQATDFPQWTTGIFNKSITEPQYNVRIGHFLDDKKSIAVELSFDHTKYSSVLNQTAHLTGVVGGQPVETDVQLSETNFNYMLHNGANHVMLNVVKRIPLFREVNQTWSVSGLGKLGAGIMLPHADNTIFGQNNDVGSKEWGNYVGVNSGWWRINGWAVGIEAGARFVVWNPIFLELTDKVAYSKLYNVPVYRGTADQSLWMDEVILNLGWTINS